MWHLAAFIYIVVAIGVLNVEMNESKRIGFIHMWKILFWPISVPFLLIRRWVNQRRGK